MSDDEVDNDLLDDEPPDELEDGPADDIADEQNASEAENEDDEGSRRHLSVSTNEAGGPKCLTIGILCRM